MAQFRYRAYTSTGQLAEGELEARSASDAHENLWSRGLTPFETKKIGAAGDGRWWQREIFTRRGAKLGELAAFTREFAMLEQAEVPIDDGLRILAQQSASAPIKRLADGLLADVLDGATLSEAMRRRTNVFPEEYISVVRAGETGAALGRVLSELADLMERRVELRAKMRSALTYPAVLIFMALVSTAIVVGFLVPSIAPIFADTGKPMPAGLRIIVALEENWPYLAAAALAAAVLLTIVARSMLARPEIRTRFDRMKLRLPVAGPLVAKMQMAKFARTLGALLRAGVPLLQALGSAHAVVANRAYSADLGKAIDAVRNGESLGRALAGVADMPAVMTQMVRVGEESRKIDQMLLRVAAMFETQSQRQIDRMMGLLTPVLTIAIAGVVGALILTVMSAILGINELAAQ